MRDNCVKNKGKTHACRLSSGRIFKEAGRAAGISGLCCLRIHTVQRFLLGQLAPFGVAFAAAGKKSEPLQRVRVRFWDIFFRSPGE